MSTVLQVQLGATRDPLRLIPGSARQVTADSNSLLSMAEALGDAAQEFGQIDVTSWRGEASDRAQAAFESLRARLTMAASAFVAVSAALSAYADVLLWAQAQARIAIQLWDQGLVCTPADAGASPFITLTADQRAAQQTLGDARAAVHHAAQRASNALNEATEFAPRDGGFWNDVGKQWSSFWHGAWEPVEGMGVLAWQGNSVRMAVDPNGWWRDRQALIVGLWISVQNPKQFGKDMVDWDTWAEDPARASGHLVPDTLLNIFSGGVGGAALKGATTAAKVAEDAAGVAGASAAREAVEGAAEEAVEQAAKKGPGDFTEEELARPTPGTQAVVFQANANMSPAELQQGIEWVRAANEARLAGGLSESGRVAMTDELRAMSKAEAALERTRAAAAGTPYSGVASHMPDRTWLNDKPAWAFADHTLRLNSSFAGQVGRFPVGTVPTIFQFRMLDGRIYPEILEGGS